MEASEIERLLGQLDVGKSGRVAKSQFAASQLDWRLAQLHHRERWLASARQAFMAFDTNADGLIDVDNITETLRTKLPPDEVPWLEIPRHPLLYSVLYKFGFSHHLELHENYFTRVEQKNKIVSPILAFF